ncbi:hypothetical protein SUDANB66_03493 [Streptomyces sp. SudanB66_2053]
MTGLAIAANGLRKSYGDKTVLDGVDQRHPHARLAPAVATVLGPLPAPPALFLWGLSDMATDSCGPDDCSPELTSALWTSWTAPCCSAGRSGRPPGSPRGCCPGPAAGPCRGSGRRGCRCCPDRS